MTFLVSGVWHGANWTFIIWGAIHGVAQIVEKALGISKTESKGIVKIVRIIGTFILVTLAWVFFRMPTLSDALLFIGRMFSNFSLPEILSVTNFAIYVMAIVFVLFKEIREEFISTSMKFLENKYVKWAEYVIIFCIIMLCGALDSGAFIYGSF